MTLLAKIKQGLRTHRGSRSIWIRSAIEVLYFFRACWSFGFDGRFRTLTLLRWFHGERLHQTTVLTGLDRYPEIFSACRNYMAGRPDLKILSFGCSSGEEVSTLREYFPEARIIGAEINPRCLAQCRNLKVDDQVTFVRSDFRALERLGPFDLIFCMAVLQRTPRRVEEEGMTSLKAIYPFEKFDRQVSEFDSYLKPGGLMVIHHSQYFFKDASVAARYDDLQLVDPQPPFSAMFDRNSALVGTGSSGGSIYLKLRK